MSFSSAKLQRAAALFILLAAVLLSFSVQFASSQASTDPTTLSYQAFSQLKKVYRSGGQAPDLLARLNLALSSIQDARVKRALGDITAANKLEEDARSTVQSVLSAIPAAQEKADRDSATRTATAVALIPIIVVLSTFVFYATLRTWRYYEKMKLYEMRIVEKKAED